MRRASGHHDHVALGEHARFAAANGAAADLVGRDVLGFEDATAGDEFGFTVHDVDEVRVLGMDFSNARLFPPTGMDHVITSAAIEEHCALIEGSVHVASLEVFDSAVCYG